MGGIMRVCWTDDLVLHKADSEGLPDCEDYPLSFYFQDDLDTGETDEPLTLPRSYTECFECFNDPDQTSLFDD